MPALALLLAEVSGGSAADWYDRPLGDVLCAAADVEKRLQERKRR